MYFPLLPCLGLSMSHRKRKQTAKVLQADLDEAERKQKAKKKKSRKKANSTAAADTPTPKVAELSSEADEPKSAKKVQTPVQKLAALKKKVPPDIREEAKVGDTLGSCLLRHLPVVGGESGVYIPAGDGPSSVPRRKTADTESLAAIANITTSLCDSFSEVRLNAIPVVLVSPTPTRTGFVHDLLLVVLDINTKFPEVKMPWQDLYGLPLPSVCCGSLSCDCDMRANYRDLLLLHVACQT